MSQFSQKLYLVHCGYYDTTLCDGIYEGHANYFVAATSFEEARLKAKTLPEFAAKKMHVDGLVEIQSVDGFDIHLEPSVERAGQTRLVNHKHRDLASKPVAPTV